MADSFNRKVWLRALTIVASFAIAGGASWWFLGQVNQEVDLIVAARGKISERGKLLEMLAQFKKIGTELDAYTDRLNKLLPVKDALLDFPRDMDNLARTHNVALNFSFQGESEGAAGSGLGFLSFSFDVKGTSQNIFKYLRAVETESSQFLVTLDNIDLTQTSDGYRAASQGRVFFQKTALEGESQ